MKVFEQSLGRVSIHPEGEWKSDIEYAKLALVHYSSGNASYLAKKDVPKGVSPILTQEEDEYWQKISNTLDITIDPQTNTWVIDGIDTNVQATGDKGDKGDKGDTGLQGAKGDKGDKGDTGDTGSPGPKGDKGDTGPQGIQGVQGPKGDTGDTGAQGIKGDKGDKGDPGDLTGAKSLGFSHDVMYNPSDEYNTHILLKQSDDTDAAARIPTKETKTEEGYTYNLVTVKLKNEVVQKQSVFNEFFPIAIAGKMFINMTSGNCLPVYYSDKLELNPSTGFIKVVNAMIKDPDNQNNYISITDLLTRYLGNIEDLLAAL